MRPLDGLGSIKLKLGVVIVAAVTVTVVVVELGGRAGWPTIPVAASAVVVALVVVQVLAHGMTSPLREMARAATKLAAGEGHEPVTATSRDEVGALGRAFNAMAEELAETERLRRELVANAAHELRTPIAALRAVAENLVDGVEDADAATLADVLAQTERLQALVEQLLDLSRLEAGVVTLERREVDLRATAERAARTVSTADGGPPVRVHIPAGSLLAEVDEGRIHQVLVNLLTNARRHAPPGSEVEITGRRRLGDLELAVVDEGPGIAPRELERIFDRFHRTDDEPGTGRGGTGLGLSISREIVERHGGRLTVDPTHRPGCRLVVTLPQAPPADDRQEPSRAR